MKRPGLTLLIVVIAAMLVFVGLPYFSYAQLGDTPSESDDDFPYDLGIRFKVSYEVYYTETPRTASYLKLTVTKTDYNSFLDPEPEKVEYWTYVLHWWAIQPGGIVPDPDEAAFAVSLTVKFVADDGWWEYVKLDGLHSTTWVGYDEPGKYTEEWTVDRRGYSGVYSFDAVLLIAPYGTWNTTLDWDSEVVTQVNPFE